MADCPDETSSSTPSRPGGTPPAVTVGWDSGYGRPEVRQVQCDACGEVLTTAERGATPTSLNQALVGGSKTLTRAERDPASS